MVAVAGCVGSALLVPVLLPQLTIKKSHHKLLIDNLSAELRDECERVIRQCGLNPHNVTLYINNSFNSFSRGYRLNAVVGVSCRYLLLCNQNSHLDLMIQGKQLDWNSEDGRKLKIILQPTVQELQFTLAHEMGHMQLAHHFIAPVAIPVFLWWAHKCSLLATSRLGTVWKQILIRCGVYSTFTVTFLIAFVGIRWLFEYSADHFAASQGPQYALGGIKAMEKQLEMRKIVAKMTPGQQQPEPLIRLHPPFTARIARLHKIMEKRYPYIRKSV